MDNADWLPIVGGSLAALVLLALFCMILDVCGLLPSAQQERADRQQRAAWAAQVGMMQARHQPGQTPQNVHYAPHYAALPTPSPALLPGADLPVLPAPELPGPCTEDQVLDWGWRPGGADLLLGFTAGPRGLLAPDPTQYIAVPIGEKLCHIAELGDTGNGKTMAFMRKLVYLQAAGAQTIWINHKYTPRHPDTGFDFATIAAHTLPGRVILDMDEGIDLLLHVAQVDLPARIARYNQGQRPGPARYVFIGELLALVDRAKERGVDLLTEISRVFREGRELGLFLGAELQDALIKSMGGSTGLRSQVKTVGYYGGDPYSARGMLKVAVDEPAGRGVGWLRSYATPTATQVRIPLLTNTAVARILNTRPGPFWPGATIVDVTAEAAAVGEVTTPPPFLQPDPPPAPAPPAPARPCPVEVDPRAAQVVDLLQRGVGPAGIVKELWGVSSGRAYTTAAGELTAILATMAGEWAARREGDQ